MAEDNVKKSDQVDENFPMVWLILVVILLMLSVSYLYMVIKVFSINGVGLSEALTTVFQGAGIAIVGSGTLTHNGRQKLSAIFSSIGLQKHFHGAALFILSAVFLGIVSFIYHFLDDYFLESGRQHYTAGRLIEAEEAFLHGVELDPHHLETNMALGVVYESLGNLDKAARHYFRGVEAGDPIAFSNMGHVLLQQGKLLRAETMLRMGLQRGHSLSEKGQIDVGTMYSLHRNVGWVLLQQKKYSESLKMLGIAIGLDQKIEEKQIGGGLAYCLQTHIQYTQANGHLADGAWKTCLDNARPETIHEYEWLIKMIPTEVSACIDTSSVVGLNGQVFDRKVYTLCSIHE